MLPNNRPGTGWYHDHALEITAENAYHGLTGFYISRDTTRLGGCGQPWNLDNVPEHLLLISDKVFKRDCQLRYEFEVSKHGRKSAVHWHTELNHLLGAARLKALAAAWHQHSTLG